MSDYPTDEELENIRHATFVSPGSFAAFMAYVKSVGKYWPDDGFGWFRKGRQYNISTGGWSGNESILGAMQDNFTFWAVCWVQHTRGGHYVFEIPDDAVYFTGTTLAAPPEK